MHPQPETLSTCPWCQALLWDREGVEEGVGGQLGGNWDHGGLLCFSCVPPNLVLMSCQAHCNLEQVRIKLWSLTRHLGALLGPHSCLAWTWHRPSMPNMASMASMHSHSCLSYLEQVRIKPWSVIRHLGALLEPETHQKSIRSLFKNHLYVHLTAAWPGLV